MWVLVFGDYNGLEKPKHEGELKDEMGWFLEEVVEGV